MYDILLLILAQAAAVLGFAWLALSLSKHWQDVTGERALPALRARALRARALRGAGYSALAVSFMIAWAKDGPSFGSTLWTMLLTAGALVVVAILTARPHWLESVARIFVRK